MKTDNNIMLAVELDDSIDTEPILMFVDNHKVKLNFSPMSDNTAISDVKHMMLGGAVFA